MGEAKRRREYAAAHAHETNADLIDGRARFWWIDQAAAGMLPEGAPDKLADRPCEPAEDPERFAEYLQFLAGQLRASGLDEMADETRAAAEELEQVERGRRS